jgi:hypothetical protein
LQGNAIAASYKKTWKFLIDRYLLKRDLCKNGERQHDDNGISGKNMSKKKSENQITP